MIATMNVNNDRHTRFRQRRYEQGFRQVAVWVHERDAERIKRYAAGLVAVYEREQKGKAKAG